MVRKHPFSIRQSTLPAGATSGRRTSSLYCRYIKRALDILLSGIAIIVFFPFHLIISLLIKLDSPGPVFFCQTRIGLHQKPFRITKYRTMKIEAPSETPKSMLPHADQWVTRVGRFLRRWSIDEIPQIIQIFTGKMSLIGPRPALWNQTNLVMQREQYGANDIRPGLSGWAQINGRDELDDAEKARLDGAYAQNVSFLLDAKCVLLTIVNLFIRKDERLYGR